MKILVIGDPHANYQYDNRRAEWLGRLIVDVKPSHVVCLGDTADMPSLSSYDKGKKSFQGRTFSQDVDSHGDFQDRLWGTVKKAKKRLPRRISLIGNHEQRIERAIELQPELEGVISYDCLELDRWYDEVIPYTGGTPGTTTLGGVTFAHYLVSGISGRPISGEHPAYALLSKQFTSCVVGHSHLFDYCIRTRTDGKKIMGLVGGCFFDKDFQWAGEANKLYWRGVTVLDNVENGCYDLEAISLQKIKKLYN